jgi:TRAP transporter TAXI family solute receptor
MMRRKVIALDQLWLGLIAAGLTLVAILIALPFMEPAPPRRVGMSTGSMEGAYHAFGKRYAQAFSRAGIALDLRPSVGSVDNLARLSDAKSGISIALVQGGLASAATHPDLTSVGRMFLEPLWVFHRADLNVDLLPDLEGRRIAVGMEGSGTRALAKTILDSAGVTAANTTLVPLGAQASVDALRAGQVDVIFLSMAADSPLVRGLLLDTTIAPMSFVQADAFTRLYPYLVKVNLPQGIVDLKANRPPRDVTLVASATTLMVRKDLHPALVGLLVTAAQDVHAGASLFARPNEFPQAFDTEVPMNEDAALVYKNGRPFLERYLPFWLATFLERTKILLIPLIGILIPLFNIAPKVYQWRFKQRMLRWYGRLKRLEHQINSDRSPERLAGYADEIHRIEESVRGIKIPVAFSDQFYALRGAVDLVRSRITDMIEAAKRDATTSMS